ncbi:transcription terminating nucleic-acid-binding protein [Sphingomonas sp. Leaf33]|nr:transcription terminating nucleic-acid-binding protein [Sphingomonas sp. Leaf33]
MTDSPERTCILSRDIGPREGLVRLALSPDGDVAPDVRAKAPGRGAWIGVSRAELKTAVAKGKLKGALARAFKGAKISVPDDLAQRIEQQLERHALDRLGLEAKAGNLLIGAERIETAARSGQLHLLLHASDARPDGASKLAQAWRVGSDREGTDLKGLVLPVTRTTLSVALGRENVVHAGLTDAQAARRVREALTRWLHFIGPERAADPRADDAQGPSAPDITADPTAGSASTGL